MIGTDSKDGTHTAWTFDDNGNTLTATDEEGYVVSYTYDKDGRQTSIQNARGFVTAYEYDKVGNLICTTDALDGNTKSVFDANGNLISETDCLGNTTTYGYDKLGRVLTINGPDVGITATEYDANGNVTKVIDAEGHVITYTYDALNRLSSYVDTEGYSHSFTYDGNGNILTETDGNGNVTNYTYDGLDRMIGKTDGQGGLFANTYDADGRLVKTVNEVGAETSYVYDEDNRVIQMTDALGNTTTFTYDAMDRVLTITDPRGGVTTYTYTDRGDIATETDGEGYVISYKYDGNHNMVEKMTEDGKTTYFYDALDRLISTTTPDGKTETLEYDALGRVTASIDKGGHKTSYVYDAAGKVTQTTDAKGNVSSFAHDKLGNLVKTTLHRVDNQDKLDEYEVTLYKYDGRGLVTKVVDALGNVSTHEYDGNGNLKRTVDADGYVTSYTYNALDLATEINYNGGKKVNYQYNALGDLVEMKDWTGTSTYEVDLLSRLSKVTDHKGKVVSYEYDATGNQTKVNYPDGTSVTKTYDLVSNLKTVQETDGRTTRYQYDGMGRVKHMEYPDGWQEDYTYDAIGQVLKIEDTDPTKKDLKQQKNTFQYDDCGNMTYEYMRGNGTGEATTETFYTYDALHQVVKAKETYGNASRSYEYDSLGNLTYESNSNNVKTDYKLNNLNQITTKSNDGWKTSTTYTYDKRGNLTKESYTKNKKTTVVGAYRYDETNKMVSGTNDKSEVSNYVYNGLNALVQNEWLITKNAYGYHSVDAAGEKVSYPAPGLKKGSTVVKQFVVDYTKETQDPLMETEVNGFAYRYVYGNERLSVNIKGVQNGQSKLMEQGDQIRLYYHTDLRGTVDYLTNPISQKVESWTHYNEWGEITHKAVLKCGQRELDLVKNYTGHDYDQVLGLYYAKARMYDPADRRFAAVDPIYFGSNRYRYCSNNPLKFVDPLGLVEGETDAQSLSKKDYLNHIATLYNRDRGNARYYGLALLIRAGANLMTGLHNIAQMLAFAQFKSAYSGAHVELEYNTGNGYADIVAIKNNHVYVAEIKPFYHYLDKTSGGWRSKASWQLEKYFTALKCLTGFSSVKKANVVLNSNEVTVFQYDNIRVGMSLSSASNTDSLYYGLIGYKTMVYRKNNKGVEQRKQLDTKNANDLLSDVNRAKFNAQHGIHDITLETVCAIIGPTVTAIYIGALATSVVAGVTYVAVTIAGVGTITAAVSSVDTIYKGILAASLISEGAKVTTVNSNKVVPFVAKTAKNVYKIFFAA